MTPATQKNNVLAVSGFVEEYAGNADIEVNLSTIRTASLTHMFWLVSQQFLKTYRPDMNPKTTYKLTEIEGGEDPQGSGDAGAEAVRARAV